MEPEQHTDFAEVVESSARLSLQKLAEAEGVDARIIVKTGEIEPCLTRLLESERFDLAVLSRGVFGSEAEPNGLTAQAYAVIRSAPCPVLSV